MTLGQQDMWAMYVQGIATAKGVPSSFEPDDFILAGTAVPAPFHTSSTAIPAVPKGRALAAVFELADSLLQPQGVYQPANASFFSQYTTYIDGLEPQGAQPTPSDKAAISKAKADLTQANDTYTKDLQAAAADYKARSALFPGKWPTFQAFVNGTTWGATLSTDRAAVIGQNATLGALMNKVYGRNYKAISAAQQVVDQVRTDLTASSPSTPAEMLIETDAGNLVVATYVPGDLATFSSWVDIAATGPASGQSPEVDIRIAQGSAKYDFASSSYMSRTNWGADFFLFRVGGSSSTQRQSVSVDTSSSSFAIDIRFQSVTTLTLREGPWYDSSLMYDFENAPGLVLPSSLLVGMMPSVKLTFDAASYASAFSEYQKSSAFGVGAFVVAGGSSSSQSQTGFSAQWDAASSSVTIQQTDTQPVVLGMSAHEPNPGLSQHRLRQLTLARSAAY